MIRTLVTLALTGAALLAAAGIADAATPAAPYVVVLADGINSPSTVTNGLAHRLAFEPQLRYQDALNGFSAVLTPSQVDALRADPTVAFVEVDSPVEATGTLPLAVGETAPAGIRRVGGIIGGAAHEAAGAVAVLDSGIDLANSDLDARSGVNCVKPGTAAQDDNGHGTNVAGIIGARNTGAGVVGVAPATALYSVKVLGRTGSGTLSQILCGINWLTANAAALGIHVANMSITGAGSDDGNCGNTKGDAWHKAICAGVAAGVTWVVSAGNSAADFAKSIPAAYPEVLTVTAMSDTDGAPGALGPAPSCKKGEADDRYAAYSSYAVTAAAAAHTIAAPGTCVVSTKLGGGTSTYYGTSQAAPHAAAAAALCFGSASGPGPCAGLAPAAAIQRLRDDATASDSLATGFAGDPLRPLSGRVYGPLVNAATY